MFSYCLMDHIHSWRLAESHQLMDVVNLVHYILNIIDSIIVKTRLLKELRREKLRCCWG